MGYLTTHCDDCSCKADDPRYATLCELLAVLAQERRDLTKRLHAAETERDVAEVTMRHMQDRVERLVQGNIAAIERANIAESALAEVDRLTARLREAESLLTARQLQRLDDRMNEEGR